MNGAKEFAYRLRCDSALAPDTATSLLLEKAAEMIFALQAEIHSANEVTDENAKLKAIIERVRKRIHWTPPKEGQHTNGPCYIFHGGYQRIIEEILDGYEWESD